MKNNWQLILLLLLMGGLAGCTPKNSTADSTNHSTHSMKTTNQTTSQSSSTVVRSDFDDAINQLIVESNGELIGVAVEPKEGIDEIVIRLQDAFAEKPVEERQRLCDLYQTRINDAYVRFYLPEHPGEKQPIMYYQTENGHPIAATTMNEPNKVNLQK